LFKNILILLETTTGHKVLWFWWSEVRIFKTRFNRINPRKITIKKHISNFWMRHTKFSFEYITIFDSNETSTVYMQAIFRRVLINNEKHLLAVCLSVCLHVSGGSHRKDFREIWHWRYLQKSVEKINMFFKPDKTSSIFH